MNRSCKINKQAKQIAYNVYSYFKARKQDHNSTEYLEDVNLNKLVAKATGLSVTTICKIIKEGNELKDEINNVNFKSPKKNKQIQKKKIEVDSFTEGVVRRKIPQFYTVYKKVPTLKILNAKLREEGILNCGREYLRTLIHKLGFRFKKCQSKRKLLIEQPNIVSWRWRYLNAIKKHRRDQRNIVYLDETYVNSSLNEPACWQSNEERGVLSHIGKGPRLIIVHAGGQAGFIDGALLIFKSKSKTGDYHSDMNFVNFSKWTREKLLPNLPPRSVIVMDNAAYHSVQEDKKPTMISTKAIMQTWLQRHNVEFDTSLRKCDLLNLIKQHATENIYKIDEILKAAGHEVLRLPPYHPDLNPIELVWGDIKGQLAKIEIDSNLDKKKNTLEQLFAEFSVEKWVNCDKHVQTIENEYCLHDRIVDEEMDRFIINLQDSDSSSYTDSDDDSSDMDISDE